MDVFSPYQLLRFTVRGFFFGAPLRFIRDLLRPIVRVAIGERSFKKMYYLAYMKLKPDGGYDDAFFEFIERHNEACYPFLAETLMAHFHPESLVDVGCGSGGISAAFMKAGCRDIHSFDYSRAALQRAKARGLPDVRHIDLGAVDHIPAKGDVCICLEVAEHLPESLAPKLCKLLSETAPTLVMTAAPPGQDGGHLHVNEQPQRYWINLMRKFGMRYDADAVASIRRAYNGKMIRDYDVNLMIFRRAMEAEAHW
jgi:SAM-dependent methyltransferase